MRSWKIVAGPGLFAAATLLGGCAYGDYGYPEDVGPASAGYYADGPYYADGYAGPGYGGYAGYGWYDGSYYPGSGLYIYDRLGHRRPMRDSDREHWRHRDGRNDGVRGNDGVAGRDGVRGGDRRGGDIRDGDRRGNRQAWRPDETRGGQDRRVPDAAGGGQPWRGRYGGNAGAASTGDAGSVRPDAPRRFQAESRAQVQAAPAAAPAGEARPSRPPPRAEPQERQHYTPRSRAATSSERPD